MKHLCLALCTLAACALTGTHALAADITAFRAAERNDGKPPFVRLVLDLSEGVNATAALDKSGKTLSVVLKDSAPTEDAAQTLKVNKQNVKTAALAGDGSDARLTIAFRQEMALTDIKVFPLKKNGKLPPRLVVDVSSVSTAGEKDSADTDQAKAARTDKADDRAIATAAAAKAVTDADGKDKDEKEDKEEKAKKESVKEKKSSGLKGAEDKKSDKKSSRKKNSASSSKNVPATISVSADDKKILKGKVICLDPGHGGADVGAIGNLKGKAIYEKDINLSIALPLRDMLKDAGAKVIMTRSTDKDVSRPYAADREELQARCNVAAKGKADIFVSIHIDSFSNSSVDGTTAYYYPKTARDLLLARSLHESMMTNMAIPDRGVRSNDLYVNVHTRMPSVLMEMGFISNPHRLNMLTSSWGPKRIAECMYQGIVNYFRQIS